MRKLQSLTVGLLLTAGIGLAQVSGTIWQNIPNAGDASNAANRNSATLPTATFISSGIDYCSNNDPGCPALQGYTASTFLQNPTFSGQANGFNPNGTINNTELEFTGSIFLNNGNNTYQIGHDDGLTLAVDGGVNCSTDGGSTFHAGTACVNRPGPTGFAETPFIIDNPGAAGLYNFTLDYSECCGPPADLVFAFASGVAVGSVPEPASVALFGTLLAGVSWTLRRKKA